MAYVKHEDLCGAFKGIYISCCLVLLTLKSWCVSKAPFFVFCRWHTLSYPCSNRNTARGARTRSCKFPHLVSFGLAVLWFLIWQLMCVCLCRRSTDKGNTRSASRALLVPSRFYWSTRTLPVPLLLFCPSRLQMTSFKGYQHLPLSSPRQPHRSGVVKSLFCVWLKIRVKEALLFSLPSL